MTQSIDPPEKFDGKTSISRLIPNLKNKLFSSLLASPTCMKNFTNFTSFIKSRHNYRNHNNTRLNNQRNYWLSVKMNKIYTLVWRRKIGVKNYFKTTLIQPMELSHQIFRRALIVQYVKISPFPKFDGVIPLVELKSLWSFINL